MVNRSKAKGTATESAVVAYFREHGWPYVERRALTGNQDKGDVAGMPGLAIEVKCANAGIRMGTWIAETHIERLNANADHGILVIKPWGVGERNMDSWLAAMAYNDFLTLWQKALVAPELPVVVINDPVQSYSEKHLKWQLSAKVRALTDPREVMAMTLRPPGKQEEPEAWYRVLTLAHMTRLLHAAGYGDAPHDREPDAGATGDGGEGPVSVLRPR